MVGCRLQRLKVAVVAAVVAVVDVAFAVLPFLYLFRSCSAAMSRSSHTSSPISVK